MIALAAVVAVLTGDVRLEGQASARLETRARTSTGNDLTSTAAGDAEVTPTLSGSIENLGGRIQLIYSPTFRVREPYYDPRVINPSAPGMACDKEQIESGACITAGRRPEFNQRQTLDMQWSREGKPRLYLLENFYYGRTDLAVQRSTTAATFRLGQISEATIDVNGGIVFPLGRLVSLDTSAGFNYSAGLDRDSIRVLPSQRAWRTRAKLDAQLSTLDVLSGVVDAQYSAFPGLQSESTIAAAAVRWRRQLVRPTAVEVGALMGVVYGRWVDRPESISPTPGGDATLINRFDLGQHLITFDFGLRVAPSIDRFVAAAYSRGEVFTNLGWVFRERWSVAGRAGVARSLTAVRLRAEGTEEQFFTTFAEVRAGYTAPRYWRVDLSGINSTFVLIGSQNVVNNWIVSLSLTLHAEGQI
ncbi:MAG: hypothetical protein JNK82_38350 [Myxococcaceae bacterium]|nr:hypothetical protein [Myxococcaceae bacterium]